MTSYIIIAKKPETREKYALDITKKHHIDPFDITFIQTEGTIGIEEVRNLQKNVMFTPIKSSSKAAIIKNAHKVSVEAQNALLKLLEEPPLHTYIILTAETGNNFLPTILSRCTIINITQEQTFSEDEKAKWIKQLHAIFQFTIAEKLILAETVGKDKETALSWLEQLTLAAHEKMLTVNSEKDKQTYCLFITKLQRMYSIIKSTNVNPRFAMENLFLDI